MKVAEILLQSLRIRDDLKANQDFPENRIDDILLPVLPFRITNKIKLIIIGQDPTVKISKSRQTIEYSLNLDKPGSLKSYINKICSFLHIDFENVYATNIFKYFYTIPPQRTMHVLFDHFEPNIRLLKDELAFYPRAKVITLGLPALQLLAGENAQVSYYWDYDKTAKGSNGKFSFCKSNENNLGRSFSPFPHQPSLVKNFYSNTLKDYCDFVHQQKG